MTKYKNISINIRKIDKYNVLKLILNEWILSKVLIINKINTEYEIKEPKDPNESLKLIDSDITNIGAFKIMSIIILLK